MYWTLNQIPELAGLPARERGRRWRKAYRMTLRHAATWAGLAACGLIAGLGAMVGGMLGGQPVGAVLGAALGGGVGGLVFSQVAIAVARRRYRHILLGQ